MNGRGGFTLVETLVAVVILAVGVLGATGTGVVAMRLLSRAEARQDAATAAAMLLDSLALLDDPGSGRATLGRFEASWSTAGGEIEVRLHPAGDSTADPSVFRGAVAVALPDVAEELP